MKLRGLVFLVLLGLLVACGGSNPPTSAVWDSSSWDNANWQ